MVSAHAEWTVASSTRRESLLVEKRKQRWRFGMLVMDEEGIMLTATDGREIILCFFVDELMTTSKRALSTK